MRDRIYLVDPRLIHARLCMADAYGQHTAEAIQIALSRFVPDVFTLSLNESERLLIISRDGGEKKFLVLFDSAAHRRSLFLWIHRVYTRSVTGSDGRSFTLHC